MTIDDAGVPVFRAVRRFRVTVQHRKMVEFGLPTMASEHCPCGDVQPKRLNAYYLRGSASMSFQSRPYRRPAWKTGANPPGQTLGCD